MTATDTDLAPRRSRAQFHPLTVGAVERLTADAVAVTFDVPTELRDAYGFSPGQHLTLRSGTAEQPIRRNYSICSPPAEGRLRIAVKRIEGGRYSCFANEQLRVGDVVDVMTPTGRFGLLPATGAARHVVAIVAGSGITPVMSIMGALLAEEPGSRFTLVYGNRDSASVMFAEEIADLKDRFTQRLQVLHVLSREPHDAELLQGRIDDAKLDRILDSVVPPETVDEWLLCGPFELVERTRERLRDRGVAPETVHLELFHVDGEAPRTSRPRSAASAGTTVTVRLDGRSTTFPMPAEGSVLDATLAVRADAPFACKGGVCGTCRAKVREGSVDMARNYALDPAEVDRGYVLACQSVPTTPAVVLDFDA